MKINVIIFIAALLCGGLRSRGDEFLFSENYTDLFDDQFLFFDASMGGKDLFSDAWAMVYTGLWMPGSEVEISGLVLPIRTDGNPNNVHQNTPPGGTFTLYFYDLGKDEVFSGISKETLIASKTVSFNGRTRGTYAVQFNSPIFFVATGGGIAIHTKYSKIVRFKWDSSDTGTMVDQMNGLPKEGCVRMSLAGRVFAPEQEQRGEKIELPLSMANPGQAFAEVSPLNNHKSSGVVFGMMGFIVPVIILFLRKPIE